MQDKTRITVSISADLINKFSLMVRKVRLSKDTIIASTLAQEVGYLRGITPNGPKAQRLFRAISSLKGDRKRLSVSLDKSLAEEVSQVCDEKGISRDQFIGAYISFLVNGDPDGSCASPLAKAIEMLRDPRFEYATVNGSNPYDELYMSEHDVDHLIKSAGNRSGEEEI